MKHTGFTGTRKGMTRHQINRLIDLLGDLDGWWHHGDCEGADEESHAIAKEAGLLIALHPPINPKSRAYCKGADKEYPEAEYMERNQDIVDACEHLIATPREMIEQRRGGTWATIRMAKDRGIAVTIILPNGELKRTAGH